MSGIGDFKDMVSAFSDSQTKLSQEASVSNEVRKSFETWMISKGFDVSRDTKGFYHSTTVEGRWDTWRAAVASAAAPKLIPVATITSVAMVASGNGNKVKWLRPELCCVGDELVLKRR